MEKLGGKNRRGRRGRGRRRSRRQRCRGLRRECAPACGDTGPRIATGGNTADDGRSRWRGHSRMIARSDGGCCRCGSGGRRDCRNGLSRSGGYSGGGGRCRSRRRNRRCGGSGDTRWWWRGNTGCRGCGWWNGWSRCSGLGRSGRHSGGGGCCRNGRRGWWCNPHQPHRDLSPGCQR